MNNHNLESKFHCHKVIAKNIDITEWKFTISMQDFVNIIINNKLALFKLVLSENQFRYPGNRQFIYTHREREKK